MRLIDADALNLYDISPAYGFSVYGVTAEDIGLAPTIEPERPKGEWIKATSVAPPEFTGRYACSSCGHYALMDMPYGNRQELSHYCPNCGAKMGE